MFKESPASNRRDLDSRSGTAQCENFPHLDIAGFTKFLEMTVKVARSQAQEVLEFCKPDSTMKVEEKTDGEAHGIGNQLIAFKEFAASSAFPCTLFTHLFTLLISPAKILKWCA
jgi:hypothetical protein